VCVFLSLPYFFLLVTTKNYYSKAIKVNILVCIYQKTRSSYYNRWLVLARLKNLYFTFRDIKGIVRNHS
jgi:hypothetical protein